MVDGLLTDPADGAVCCRVYLQRYVAGTFALAGCVTCAHPHCHQTRQSLCA